MKIKFAGACKEVTGSKHILTINGLNILLDCGFKQGNNEENYFLNKDFLFNPKEIDVLLLSHAHLDHCGNIPNLYKQGFTGNTYTHQATKELSKFIVLDALKIQSHELPILKDKFPEDNIQLLYDEKDINLAWSKFIDVKYNESFNLSPEIKVTFINAGHILGSAQILIEFFDKYDKKNKKLLFTGDLGRKNLPLLRNPEYIDSADIVISESTYGNSVHDDIETAYEDLVYIINDVYKRGGKLLIPSFAMERTQELVYILHYLQLQKRIPFINIFVDSPLANEITKVYKKHKELYDNNVKTDFLNVHSVPLEAKNIFYIDSVEESKKINSIQKPIIIISGAGMLSGGRMLHHLIHNLNNPNNFVLIIGYMVKHSLGRNLLEAQNNIINILGNEIEVKASIDSLDSFSGHADKIDLLNYLPNIKGLKDLYLVHGDPDQMLPLKDNIEYFNKNINIHIPDIGEIFIN